MKKRIIKAIITWVAIVVIILLGLFVKNFSNPYKFISTSMSEDELYYIELYSILMPEEKFEKLLISLVDDNSDIKILNLISKYSNNKRKCFIIPFLEERYVELLNYPLDSTWTINYDASFSRIVSRKMLDYDGNFFYYTERLKNKCGVLLSLD